MKRIYFLCALLLIPTLVSAKTVTCTSQDDFTVGKNVYDDLTVTCSEGEVELFAVEETSNELTWNPVVNPYPAVDGKKYTVDFVWTGTFDNSVDTIIVDGENQAEWSVGCDTGCHLYTKTVVPKPATTTTTTTGEEKEIAVGTIYYVGDRIKFNDILIILDADTEGSYAEIEEGSYTVPAPEFTEHDNHSFWEFDGFMKEYDESELVGFSFGYNTNVSADKEPIGVKCTGGVGTVADPFRFEPVYADDDNQNETGMVTYTILEGANQTYYKGSNGTIVIKASGDLAKVIAIEIDNGNIIDPSNYELASGSTILTLKTTFLENSSLGEHTITIKYDDGEAETKLTIANATDNNPTTGDDNGQGTGDNNQGTGDNNGQGTGDNNQGTGDNNQGAGDTTNTTGNETNPETADGLMNYVSMLVVSIIGLVGVGLYLKKKRFN